MMHYEHLRRRVAAIDSGIGCYYPPDDPRSKYTDDEGLHILVPGALTPRGEREGAEQAHLLIPAFLLGEGERDFATKQNPGKT